MSPSYENEDHGPYPVGKQQVGSAPDAPRCPQCKRRGAASDWKRLKACPQHGCGYRGRPE